jgi:hypothetical protein
MRLQISRKQENQLSSRFTIFSPRETMTELGISKLVKTTRCCNTKVAPDVLTAPEVEFLNSSRTRLESLKLFKEQIWITCTWNGNAA